MFPNAEAYTGVKVDLHYGRDVFSVVHAYEIFRDMWPLYCYFFVSAYFFLCKLFTQAPGLITALYAFLLSKIM